MTPMCNFLHFSSASSMSLQQILSMFSYSSWSMGVKDILLSILVNNSLQWNAWTKWSHYIFTVLGSSTLRCLASGCTGWGGLYPVIWLFRISIHTPQWSLINFLKDRNPHLLIDKDGLPNIQSRGAFGDMVWVRGPLPYFFQMRSCRPISSIHFVSPK